jgi:hypothetical protein
MAVNGIMPTLDVVSTEFCRKYKRILPDISRIIGVIPRFAQKANGGIIFTLSA